MKFKETVEEIVNLPWDKAKPEDLIYLARGTAIEFASSLRKAIEIYPDDPLLREMTEGELDTDNLTYEDYNSIGDHWMFLDYYIKKNNIKPSSQNIEDAINTYISRVEELFNSKERAMTVFSREEELVAIFQEISSQIDWVGLGYGFYKHYLDSHIEFDSGDDGHHHLTAHYPLFPDVLEKFYAIRLEMYQSLFTK